MTDPGQPTNPPEGVFASHHGQAAGYYPPNMTPGGSPVPPKRKSWPARHKVWTALIVVGVLAIIGGIASGGGDPSPTAAPAASASITAKPPAPKPSSAAQKTSAPAPVAKTWHKVITAAGNADKRTPSFTLTSGQARLRYTARDTSGIGAIVVMVYVVEKGHSLNDEGGFPEVTLSEPGASSTELANPPGDYYLDVKAANARWTVTIEELR